jgi:NitT/TauT family transport system substrate-binding protein
MAEIGKTPSRRSVLRRVGAALATSAIAPVLPMPALGAPRTVKFTLAWLAQGTSLYTYVSRARGMMQARGIDLDIARGFGSIASAQAIAGGQFDFGTVAAPALILSVAKGLPLIALATCDYDSTMGVGVLEDSPIRSPKDLAGKKIASVPTSAEFPFLPAYAKKAGLDTSAIESVHVDNKVLERVLIEKQVDAISGFGQSNLAAILSKGVSARWMLYSSVGIRNYGQTIATQAKTLESDTALCEAMTDALLEAVAFTMTNPDESLDIFMKEVPEMALNPSAREFARLGLGMWHEGIDRPEPREHGLGWSEPSAYAEMTDLVMEYLSAPGMTRPEPGSVYNNQFIGKVQRTPAEWDQFHRRIAEFAKYLA